MILEVKIPWELFEHERFKPAIIRTGQGFFFKLTRLKKEVLNISIRVDT